MNIIRITPNYVLNTPNNVTNTQNTNAKCNTSPNFTGALGDKFVRELSSGATVETKQIMDAVKGTFGSKSDKVSDVVESLLAKITSLMKESSAKSDMLEAQRIQSAQEMAAVKSEAREEIKQTREWSQNVLSAKDKELAAKDVEVKEAKEFAAKYEPMVKVKSIEEIGTVMPDEAVKIIDEITESKEKALDSMVEFLMTGKGQEEAISQLNRIAVLEKAQKDGIIRIPEIEKKVETVRKEHGIYNLFQPEWAGLEMIRTGLYWSPKGEYLASPVIKQQVKENAMGLLTPYFLRSNKTTNIRERDVEDQLEGIFKNVTDFRNGLAKGRENLANRYHGQELKEEIVPYDFEKSKVIAKETYNGQEYDHEYTYNQISNFGNSQWT